MENLMNFNKNHECTYSWFLLFFDEKIEFEKKIISNMGFAIYFQDPDEFSYKKNIQLVPEHILKKYSNLRNVINNAHVHSFDL